MLINKLINQWKHKQTPERFGQWFINTYCPKYNENINNDPNLKGLFYQSNYEKCIVQIQDYLNYNQITEI
jgi:hypothetical protein